MGALPKAAHIWPRIKEIADRYEVAPAAYDDWPLIAAMDVGGLVYDVAAIVDRLRERLAEAESADRAFLGHKVQKGD